MGATVHTHYCMNRIVGTSLFAEKDEKCPKCGMTEENKKGCCKDEHQYHKLSTDHSTNNTVIDFTTTVFVIPNPIQFEYKQVALFAMLKANKKIHPPPILERPKLHVLYCSFLI
jgi:hypothetical protein